MIQNNYFTENDDLMLHFDKLIDWQPIVEDFEDNYADAKAYQASEDERFAMAPGNLDEALVYYRSVLESLGELMGTYVAPRSPDMDKEGLKYENGKVTFPKSFDECYDKLREAGLQPFSINRKYGGLSLPAMAQVICCEISARADASFCLAYGSVNIAEIVERYGSEEMCNKWMPQLADGSRSCAMALTEPNYGSDLSSVQTKAVQDDDGSWRITGAKRFITHGCGYKDAPSVILTLARTGSPTSGARGLSFFLVDGRDVEVAGIEKKMGLHCSPTCEVVYDNAPATLIGKTGYGLIKYSMGMMNSARLTIAAQALGIASAAYFEARKYASEREQFGKTIENIPAVRRMLDRMEREMAGMRVLCYETARIIDKYIWRKHRLEHSGMSEREVNRDPGIKKFEKLADLFTPLSKYYITEMSLVISSDAIQIHGGAGYTEEYDVARIYRDARITTIYEGTTQLQVVGSIGGVVAGMSATGNLREYLEEQMKSFDVSDESRQMFSNLEQAVEIYKEQLAPDMKDTLAFEVVEIAARTVIGVLLEQSNQKLSGTERGAREAHTQDYNVDSLAIAEADLVRLRRASKREMAAV